VQYVQFTRTVDCTYCATANILPDSLWSVLHPPRIKQRWWLACLVREDPRRALPELPKPPELPRYKDNALEIFGMVLFALVIFPIGGTGLWVAMPETGQIVGRAAVVVLSCLFLSFLASLMVRYRSRKRWHSKRSDREDQIDTYNTALRTFLPENEVVARITKVDADGQKSQVVLFSPSEPENLLGTNDTSFETCDLDRLGGVGAMVRAWFDRPSARCRVSSTPSVLMQVGTVGLEPRDATSLPRLEMGVDEIPGYNAYLIPAAISGALLGLTCYLVLFR
jgi:hypothetical protein